MLKAGQQRTPRKAEIGDRVKIDAGKGKHGGSKHNGHLGVVVRYNRALGGNPYELACDCGAVFRTAPSSFQKL